MASRPSPRLGDLIEIHRFGYSHWAIYVGDGYVVHLAPPSEYVGAGSSSIMSALTDRAVVKKELLSTVAGRGKYQVNNKYDDRYPRLPITKIVKQALELVGKEIRYSVTSRNCEHFVTELRYGVPCSDQVAEVATNVVVGAGVVAGALGVIGLVLSRSKRERQ